MSRYVPTQPELFEAPVPERGQHPNPCVRKHGFGPEGVRCVSCSRLSNHVRGRRYYKCELRGVTHSPATDHRVSWDACALYEAAK